MRILLIRLSSIGDVVLQTPVASWLKLEFPNCHITFLTANEFTCIIDNHPHIDKVIGMERFRGKGQIKKLYQFSREVIHSDKIDLIIDLHNNTRTRLFSWFNPKTKLIRIDKRQIERKVLVSAKLDLLKKTPSIHWRNIQDLAKIMGRTIDFKCYREFLGKINPALNATSLPGASEVFPRKNKKIIIAAMASFTPKRWPVEKYSLLIDSLLKDSSLSKYEITILGGREDKYLLPLEKFATQNPNRVHYLQGKTTLKETIEQIKKSAICIGNDTGMGHIAEALGVASIVIFGPTSPSFGFGVHGRQSKNIYTNEKCSPCSSLGNQECKFRSQYCMDKIEVFTIKNEAKSILEDLS